MWQRTSSSNFPPCTVYETALRLTQRVLLMYLRVQGSLGCFCFTTRTCSGRKAMSTKGPRPTTKTHRDLSERDVDFSVEINGLMSGEVVGRDTAESDVLRSVQLSSCPRSPSDPRRLNADCSHTAVDIRLLTAMWSHSNASRCRSRAHRSAGFTLPPLVVHFLSTFHPRDNGTSAHFCPDSPNANFLTLLTGSGERPITGNPWATGDWDAESSLGCCLHLGH